MSVKTVKEVWIEYAKACVPKAAPLTQVRETRLAFYGGFFAGLNATLKAVVEADYDDEACQRIILTLFEEIDQFRQDVMEGKK